MRKVTALSSDASGRVKIQLDTAIGGLGAAVAATHITIKSMFGYNAVNGVAVSTDAGAAVQDTDAYTYEISKVEYVCRVLELPPSYVAGAMRRVASDGGFQMDITSWTNYVDNVLENVSTQSHFIPDYSTRVRSIITIPVPGTQTEYFTNRRGYVGNLATMQAVVGQRREPQRPCSLRNWTSSDAEYPAQEYLHECVKAISATGQSMRTLRDFRDNFALCRSLSYEGSSESLAEKGFRWETTHLSSTVSPKTLYSFVFGIRRIMVTQEGGLQVMY